MADLKEVLAFWGEAGPKRWYAQDDGFDQQIRDRFGALWADVAEGRVVPAPADAEEALGLVILLDQFPRNMFRDDPRAFSTDAKALEASGQMIARGWDREIKGILRQFAYMPFMHSEDMAHQDICLDLMQTRMEDGNNALHARVHREIIARFGRFPYRNGPLGRDMTPEEQAFIDNGGYTALRQAFEAEAG